MSTMMATLEELSEEAPEGRNGDVPGRATTAPARNPLAAGTKLWSGNGGSRASSRGGCGGTEGGSEGTMAQDPVM